MHRLRSLPPPSSTDPSRRRLTTGLALACLVVAVLLATVGPVHASGVPAPGTGVWPLQPRPPVAAGFDPPATRFGSGHRGVDLGGTPGQVVRTALAGRVSFAGRLAGRGVVVVDHGSTRTTYEPVAASVRMGDRVATGQPLGHLELVGSHCFPRACLHWGLIEGADHYLDPLTLVGAASVRLLPLFSGSGTGFTPPGAGFLRAAGPRPLSLAGSSPAASEVARRAPRGPSTRGTGPRAVAPGVDLLPAAVTPLLPGLSSPPVAAVLRPPGSR